MSISEPIAATAPPPWHAALDLCFAARQGATALVHNRHYGPLRVQRVLHPEGPAVCEALMLHPPGGIAGGDVLDVSIRVESNAHALISTPGAAKWYRSAGRAATQRVVLDVRNEAALEWLPQEAILFEGSDAVQEVRIALAGEAATIGWDIVQLGRPASGDAWAAGRFRQHLELRRGDRPVWIDRADFCANDPVRTALTGLAGFEVFGTLWAASPRLGADPEAAVQALRGALESEPFARSPASGLLHAQAFAGDGLQSAAVSLQASCCVATSWLPAPANLLLLRALGNDAQRVRERLELAWSILRPFALGRAAHRPRIWAT